MAPRAQRARRTPRTGHSRSRAGPRAPRARAAPCAAPSPAGRSGTATPTPQARTPPGNRAQPCTRPQEWSPPGAQTRPATPAALSTPADPACSVRSVSSQRCGQCRCTAFALSCAALRRQGPCAWTPPLRSPHLVGPVLARKHRGVRHARLGLVRLRARAVDNLPRRRRRTPADQALRGGAQGAAGRPRRMGGVQARRRARRLQGLVKSSHRVCNL